MYGMQIKTVYVALCVVADYTKAFVDNFQSAPLFDVAKLEELRTAHIVD